MFKDFVFAKQNLFLLNQLSAMLFVYFIGTAGSGKSSLTATFQKWMQKGNYEAITVNLDPGVENLNYTPDIDIREWITLAEIMQEYNLGPNAAQIACADLLAFKIKEVKEVIDEFEADYVLIDTPGQMELFTFRQSSKYIIETLGKDNSLIVFLFDPFLAKTPSGFISQIMLCATTQFRFTLPITNALTKIDLLKEEELERIVNWVNNSYELYAELVKEEKGMQTQLSIELFKVLEDIGVYKSLIQTSAETFFGMEDLYNHIQQIFAGGEDLEKR